MKDNWAQNLPLVTLFDPARGAVWVIRY